MESTLASIADLDAITDEITHLDETSFAGANRIWRIEPAQRSNRLVVTVTPGAVDLETRLKARYGELVEVRTADAPNATSMNRDNDTPPFYGGSRISTSAGNGCTAGFSWTMSTRTGMLTAGHCIPAGGTVSWPNYTNVGFVTSASRENWKSGEGTQYLSGQSTYRGDLALIETYSYGTGPYIYTGAAGTSTHARVSQKASRWSNVGDAVCINGVTTGGWCGAVTGTGITVRYLGDPGWPWARHVNEADAPGNTCPTHGDSGAPAYRTLNDGTIAAVGIYSGGVGAGAVCQAFFTDIWDAYYGFPGDLTI